MLWAQPHTTRYIRDIREIIELYINVLKMDNRYIYQALPRLLKLWFDNHPQNMSSAQQGHGGSAAIFGGGAGANTGNTSSSRNHQAASSSSLSTSLDRSEAQRLHEF
jgi:hypothetical protein